MNRSSAFVVGLVTIGAALVFWKGLIRVLAETHPDSPALTALDELTD